MKTVNLNTGLVESLVGEIVARIVCGTPGVRDTTLPREAVRLYRAMTPEQKEAQTPLATDADVDLLEKLLDAEDADIGGKDPDSAIGSCADSPAAIQERFLRQGARSIGANVESLILGFGGGGSPAMIEQLNASKETPYSVMLWRNGSYIQVEVYTGTMPAAPILADAKGKASA